MTDDISKQRQATRTTGSRITCLFLDLGRCDSLAPHTTYLYSQLLLYMAIRFRRYQSAAR